MHDEPVNSTTDLASAKPAATAPERSAAGDEEDAPQALTQRKLIQTGELRLEVAAYAAARAAIDAELKRVGGFVANAEVRHHHDKVSSATLTLRVPQRHFHSFLRAAAGEGTVQHESLQTQDVTDVYIDTKARLRNAQRLETRLVQLLNNNTDGVKDLLEVERELARVRETIERHQGRLKMYDKQVNMSTLKLDLITREVYAAAVPATLGERISATFGDSATALGVFGRGILLFAVALVPWLLPLALLGWALVRGVRWLAAKGTAARQRAATRAKVVRQVSAAVMDQPTETR